MSRPFLQHRRPWRLYVLLVAAGLVVAVAAGLIAETALARHHRENLTVPPARPLPGASTAGIHLSPAASLPAPAGPLQVLAGTTLSAGGVRTGFPHTLAGVVSAAVQDWSQIGSDLNPARAALIGTAIADPSWHGAPAALAAGVRSTRQGLGLPATGPLPAGASVTFTAVDYQLRDVTAAQVTVMLLAYYTATVPGQQAVTTAGVYPAAMHWARGDWKILAPRGPDYSGLDAQPGSAQAAADGWLPLDQ